MVKLLLSVILSSVLGLVKHGRMPGFARFYRPSSPITIAAIVVLFAILAWVFASQMGWLR